MQTLIKQILEKYRIARTTSAYNSQNEVFWLFKELTEIISNFDFINSNPNLITKFSCGKGNWAAIPHISILDKRVTKTLENGAYIVLLFGEDGEGCHLKLGQGVTNILKEYGKKMAKDVLEESANSIRSLFNASDYQGFETKADPRISKAGELYEASTILSKLWLKDNLPSNKLIENDFRILVNCYEKYADTSPNVEPSKKIDYEWVPFFKELANKLLEYENSQEKLIAILESIGIENGLRDQNPEGVFIPMNEIDPFTFFSLILKYGSDAKRYELLSKIKNKLNLTHQTPRKYSGVPTSNAQSAWFFRYKFDRKENDVKNLWRIFKESLNGLITDDAFTDALNIKLVGFTKLTHGFFWTSADNYFPIDSPTRPYLKKLGFNANVDNRIDYLNLCKELLRTGIPLYEHSYLAWLEANEKEAVSGKKIWAIATGKDGNQWDEFLNNGIVAIGFQDIGSLDQYKTQDEITEKLLPFSGDGSKPTNDSLCMFQFANEIQVGDIVVAKSGRKLIRGAGVVKSEYIYDPTRPDHPHLRKVEWQKTTETEFPDTGTTIKTLTEISRYPEFKLLVENYLNMQTSSSALYGVQQIIDEGCFASSQEIQRMIERLKSKKNIILQGPPGTGKTWLAKRLGFALIGERNFDQLKAVQFHPNLSYEDFVRGWRPSGEGKLSLVDGPFMEAINKAKNSSSPYVVVIEEINRGNPAQIFGEMLTLLESDKRNADEGLEVSYRKSDDERVYIPENLYVIGTMNIADRSLALVDLALRRRFAFIDLKPNINSAWKSWLVDKIKIPLNIVNEVQQRMNSLNDQISKDQSLGSQYQIGHSYVTPTNQIEDPKEWFKQVVQTEIYPLLNEYWFDNPDNAIKIRDQLLQDFQ